MVTNVTEDKTRKSEIKAAITLGMVVGAYVVLWVPDLICLSIIAVTQSRHYSETFRNIIFWTGTMVIVNAAIDPIIYAYRMKSIRETLDKLFHCKKQSQKNVNNSNRIMTSSEMVQQNRKTFVISFKNQN